jgi:hypothetical protein
LLEFAVHAADTTAYGRQACQVGTVLCPESCQQSDKPTFKVLPPLAGSTTAPTPTTASGEPTTPTEPEVTQTIRPLR